jgi:hypothetical protein
MILYLGALRQLPFGFYYETREQLVQPVKSLVRTPTLT